MTESSVDMVSTESIADASADTLASDGSSQEIANRAAIPVSMPKMAYIFDYGFRLPAEDIAPLQQKHADLCEAQGPFTCQIISLSNSGEEGEYVSGQLQLAVAAEGARAFGAKLTQTATDAGGEQVSATIDGEDLSKRIVDTEARLRSRIVLRDRLLEVLRTRRGKVSELVEAERSVAAVNEEIDQARSWLKEMQGRVAFSRVNIDYRSGSPVAGGFFEPVRNALGAVGGILGSMLAAIILLGTIAVPVGLLAYLAWRLRKRWNVATVAAS